MKGFFYDPFCVAEERRELFLFFCSLFILQNMYTFSFYKKTLYNRKDITIYFWCHQSTKMFFYDPFICVQKRRKKSPQKKITISVQKQFLKLLQPHQGAEPSAGFYILEKVGKRLPPAGTGRKYRVFQLWEYGFILWKKLAKGSCRRVVDKNTGWSNSENTFHEFWFCKYFSIANF